MVINDVENDFEAVGMQAFHHPLEFVDGSLRRLVRGVATIRRQVAQGVIAPEVDAVGVDQEPLIDMVMHRHQFNRRHPERSQVDAWPPRWPGRHTCRAALSEPTG